VLLRGGSEAEVSSDSVKGERESESLVVGIHRGGGGGGQNVVV